MKTEEFKMTERTRTRRGHVRCVAGYVLLAATVCACVVCRAADQAAPNTVTKEDAAPANSADLSTLPLRAQDDWSARHPKATIVKIEKKTHYNIPAFPLTFYAFEFYERYYSFQVTGSDAWNKKLRVEYGEQGHLLDESPYKLPFDFLPLAVIDAAKKAEPNTTWAELAERKFDLQRSIVYKLTGQRGGNTVKLRLLENGAPQHPPPPPPKPGEPPKGLYQTWD
jgi:hypothetical protein